MSRQASSDIAAGGRATLAVVVCTLATTAIGCAGSRSSPSTAKQGPAELAEQQACGWVIEDGVLVRPSGVAGASTSDLDTVDIDGAPPPDLIANIGACGNWGHCEHVALLACGADRYRPTWGPEYAVGLRVVDRPAGWSDLVVLDRTGVAGCDLEVWVPWVYDGQAWNAGNACTPERVDQDWPRDCGDPPPECAARSVP